MDDVQDAIAALGRITGLQDLRLDSAGNAALLVDDSVHVYLMKIDDHHLEFVSRLDGFGTNASAPTLLRLLIANGPSGPLHRGRLSLDPQDHSIQLQQRVDVKTLDGDGFATLLQDFVAAVRNWSRRDVVELLKSPARRVTDDDAADADSADVDLADVDFPLILVR